MKRTLLAAALFASLALTACDRGEAPAPPATSANPTPASTAAPFDPDELEWQRCADRFTCATLPVPLDYDAPQGDTLDLALIRLPARTLQRRVGVLLLNFGGPGASGIQGGRAAESFLPDAILDRFDIIGWDPRGVGESTPVDCGDDFDAFFALDATPDDDAERQALIDAARTFAGDCAARSGRLLPHIGTMDAARDMDIIRGALGEEQLSYVGFSYGTLLGAVYADLFPSRVRAFVLDGAVDPQQSGEALARTQAIGFEDALSAFFAECAANRACPFNSEGNPAAAYDALMAAIDTAPLTERGGDRLLGQGEAMSGVASALYDKPNGWPALGQALANARDGDGGGLLALFDAIVGRQADGTYSNENEANAAINCVDAPQPDSIAPFDALYERLLQEAPRVGASSAYLGLACAFWPAPASPIVLPLDAPGAAPIMVIGTTKDPVTPYAWAQALAAQLDSGHLLTWQGEDHTAFGKSQCIDDAVTAYFIALELPPEGTVCR